MASVPLSPKEEIASLKHQLALAQNRLDRAESFVFDLRCRAAKKVGKALWMREGDGSGLREAYGDMEDLGDWTMLAPKSIPTPRNVLPALASLFAELALALPSSFAPSPPPSSFKNHFPPELFYHIADYSTLPTLSHLCLVSSSARAIASPRLYRSMTLKDASQLRAFLPSTASPLAPLHRSLSLDKVVSLHLVIPYGEIEPESTIDLNYPAIHLPNLLHLTLQSEWQYSSNETDYVGFLVLAKDLLPLLNPHSLIVLSDPDVHAWSELPIPIDIWQSFLPNWTRLSSGLFVDCSCCFQVGERSYVFFPGSQSPAISFSWEFTAEIEGYTGDLSQDPLIALENSGVFDHPSVQLNGIDLELGCDEDGIKYFEKDLEDLEERLPGVRSLVRYS